MLGRPWRIDFSRAGLVDRVEGQGDFDELFLVRHGILHSASVGDGLGELTEIFVAFLHGLGVTTESTVGGFQKKHRLPRFLGERHQAAIMFQRRKAIGIVLDFDRDSRGFIQHGLSVDGRDAPSSDHRL